MMTRQNQQRLVVSPETLLYLHTEHIQQVQHIHPGAPEELENVRNTGLMHT